MAEKLELRVFISHRGGECAECHAALGGSAWVFLVEGGGAICLPCADLDHLEFLPAGDAALTRRAKKRSALSAVVLKWSRARKRYERQGLLVETAALEEAEASCLADVDVRAARKLRRAEHEAELDRSFVDAFAVAVRERYPHCPAERDAQIAQHACRKYSGRIGRTAEAKRLDAAAIDLAVRAHVRHRETEYDELLARGVARVDARTAVADAVEDILRGWTTARSG